MGYSQDYQELKRYLYEVARGDDFNALQSKISNFHLLLYVHSLQILSPKEWRLLLSAANARKQDDPQSDNDALFQLVSTPGWQTLVMILQESA